MGKQRLFYVGSDLSVVAEGKRAEQGVPERAVTHRDGVEVEAAGSAADLRPDEIQNGEIESGSGRNRLGVAG